MEVVNHNSVKSMLLDFYGDNFERNDKSYQRSNTEVLLHEVTLDD